MVLMRGFIHVIVITRVASVQKKNILAMSMMNFKFEFIKSSFSLDSFLLLIDHSSLPPTW